MDMIAGSILFIVQFFLSIMAKVCSLDGVGGYYRSRM
jgi:hypothetical protein